MPGAADRRRRAGGLRLAFAAGIVLAGVAAALALVAHMSNGAPAPARASGGTGPEGVPMPAAPVLAPAASPASGQTVAGVTCGPTEQLVFRLGPARGRVASFLNGRRYTRDPRTIPLRAHAQIQLDVGPPLVAAQSIVFPASL